LAEVYLDGIGIAIFKRNKKLHTPEPVMFHQWGTALF